MSVCVSASVSRNATCWLTCGIRLKAMTQTKAPLTMKRGAALSDSSGRARRNDSPPAETAISAQ